MVICSNTEAGGLFGGAPAILTDPIGGAFCGTTPAKSLWILPGTEEGSLLDSHIIRPTLIIVDVCNRGVTNTHMEFSFEQTTL